MRFKTLVLVGLLGSFALPCAAVSGGVVAEAGSVESINSDSLQFSHDVNLNDQESINVVDLKAMCLDKDRIESYEKKICDELEWNKSVRFVAKGAGCVAGLAACLMLYNDFSIVPGDDWRHLKSEVARLAAKISHIQGCDVGESASSGGGWGSYFARQLGMMAFTSLVGTAAQKFYSNVFHKQSIKWFVLERTMLRDIEQELQVLKADMENLNIGKAFVAVSDCDRYVETILGVHNMIAEQLEQMVGYMRYKVSKLPMVSAGLLGRATTGTYLTNRIAFVAGVLNDAVAKYKLCSTNDERTFIINIMFDAVQQLMLQISTAVAQFELVEKKMQQAA